VNSDFSTLLNDRADVLNRHIRAATGGVVAAGPFQGMKLADEAPFTPGDTGAKLAGCYEAELHPAFEKLRAAPFGEVINIGAAEGYYAVGLARMFSGATVHAFETSEDLRRLARKNAIINQVHARIQIGGTCDIDALAGLLGESVPRLLVIDVEGYETVLIDPALVPSLTQATLVIECHDFIDRSITPALTERLSGSHAIEIVTEGARDPNLVPCLRSLNSFDRWLALCEYRPETMHWMIATPR
jgi:hypothetical protein